MHSGGEADVQGRGTSRLKSLEVGKRRCHQAIEGLGQRGTLRFHQEVSCLLRKEFRLDPRVASRESWRFQKGNDILNCVFQGSMLVPLPLASFLQALITCSVAWLFHSFLPDPLKWLNSQPPRSIWVFAPQGCWWKPFSVRPGKRSCRSGPSPCVDPGLKPSYPPFSQWVLDRSGEWGYGGDGTDGSIRHSQLGFRAPGTCVGTLLREGQGLPVALSVCFPTSPHPAGVRFGNETLSRYSPHTTSA